MLDRDLKQKNQDNKQHCHTSPVSVRLLYIPVLVSHCCVFAFVCNPVYCAAVLLCCTMVLKKTHFDPTYTIYTQE